MKKILLLSTLLVAPSAMGVVFNTGTIVGSTTYNNSASGNPSADVEVGLNYSDGPTNKFTTAIDFDPATFTDNGSAGFEFDLASGAIDLTRSSNGTVNGNFSSAVWTIDFSVAFAESVNVDLNFDYILGEAGANVVLSWTLTEASAPSTNLFSTTSAAGVSNTSTPGTVSESATVGEGTYKVVVTAKLNEPVAAINGGDAGGSIDINNLNLTVAIPEPSSALLCLLGGLGLLRRRRSA